MYNMLILDIFRHLDVALVNEEKVFLAKRLERHFNWDDMSNGHPYHYIT